MPSTEENLSRTMTDGRVTIVSRTTYVSDLTREAIVRSFKGAVALYVGFPPSGVLALGMGSSIDLTPAEARHLAAQLVGCAAALETEPRDA